MFSAGSPLMRTKELILDAGWRRSPQPDAGSEPGFLDHLDDGFMGSDSDDDTSFEFFDNFPPELTVHVFRHLPDVRDLIAVSQVCRKWYGFVRQYNGLWQAVYLQMPGWSIRPDARVVLERHATELERAQHALREEAGSSAAAAVAAAGGGSASATGVSASAARAQSPTQAHHHALSLWPSSSSSAIDAAERSASVAPLPYINLAAPPMSALGRARGRKSWIAAHLPDLSSLSLGGVSGSGSGAGVGAGVGPGGPRSADSSRASSHSRNSSWDLASSVRSRVLSGAASMAQTASEQLQRRRRKSVHVDAAQSSSSSSIIGGLLDPSAELDQQRSSSSSLSRTLPTSPSPLRLQLAEEEQQQEEARQRRARLSFASGASNTRSGRAPGPPAPPDPSIEQRALAEHARIKAVLPGNGSVDHFDDLDWRRLCVARWTLDRRWGLPIPPRRIGRPGHPVRMVSRASSIGNDEDFYRPVSTYLRGHEDTVYCIRMDSTFFEGAGRIVSGSRDRTVKVWNRGTGQCVHTLSGYSQSVLCLTYDDELLVTGSSDNSIVVWDFTFGSRQLKAFSGDYDGPTSTSSKDPKVIARLEGHTDKVLNIAMNAEYIASCGKEKVVRVWDRRRGDCLRLFSAHETVVNGIALTGNTAVSVSGDPTFHIWDLLDEKQLREVHSDQNEGLVCVVVQGNTIITGSRRTAIKVWDARTGQCMQTLNGHRNMVRALAYDARRGVLVSGGYDFAVLCWYVPQVDSAAGKAYCQQSLSASESAATPRTQSSPSPFANDFPTPRPEPFPLSNGINTSDPLFAQPTEPFVPSYIQPWQPSFDRAAPEVEPLSEFRDHTNRVISVAVDGTHLVSASYDQRICVRNFAVALPSDPFTSLDLELVGGGDVLCS
ncbi:hypothetical protein OC835_001396 [Tilletia horrida]|nr:hypothetical protein OC835_001396 [Tilletia horrida]